MRGFSFGDCWDPYVTYLAKKGLKKGVSWMIKALEYVAPDPAGDVDIDDRLERCKCMQYDPELKKYFLEELHLSLSSKYGRRDTEIILNKLIAKMKMLARENDESCKVCEDAYTPNTIIDNADERGVQSIKSRLRDVP